MYQELEKIRNLLEILAKSKNITIEQISKILCIIDDNISNIYLNRDIEKIDYEKNFKKILERTDREFLLSLITQDLVNIFNITNVSKFDIARTAINIYDYCCLTVHNIPENSIIHFIIRKAWFCHDLIPLEEHLNSITSIENHIEVINSLHHKYIEKIKNI